MWMRQPELVLAPPDKTMSVAVPSDRFFPIAAYGGKVGNLHQMKAVGLNGAVIRLSDEAVKECIAQDMYCLLSVPRDAEKSKVLLDSIEEIPKHGKFGFYVNDEPGIHSFPLYKAQDIRQMLHDRYPNIPTSMAVVRPQVIPDYSNTSTYFMLDQYPVPNMPMTWLSDSMDEAASYVGSTIDSSRLSRPLVVKNGRRPAGQDSPHLMK